MAPALGSVPWIAVAALGSGLALFALAVYLRRHWGKAGARWFSATLVMQGLWCLVYGVALFVSDPAWRLALEVMSWLGLTWVGYLFLGFALDYTGRSDFRQSFVYPMLGSVPAAGTLALLTTPYHDVVWSGARLVRVSGVVALDYTLELGGYTLLIVGMSYAGIGVFLLAETIFSYGPLYRNETLAVGLSTVPPTLGLFAWMFGFGPVPAINWGVVLTLPHAALDAYAFVGKNMFETNPTTRRAAEENAIDAVSDPVLVLDSEHRVVDFNQAALDTVGELTPGVRGTFASDLFGTDVDPVDGDRYLRLSTGEQTYEFRVRSAPLLDPRGEVVGYTVQFQDVTVEREREQRLTVLNRVLRHNLRNKLTTIGQYAAEIEDRTDDEAIGRFARQIASETDDLATVSEKAREFDRVRGTKPAFERVDVAALLGDLTGAFTARYDGEIDVDVEPGRTIVTDPDLLGLALQNVVENGLEHTDRETPRVRIAVSDPPDGDGVRITVEDDGPGIPEHEVGVLADGQEGTVEHGSGIGLWIVKWCLAALGGSVSFDVSESGTVVSLYLPGGER